MWGALIGAAATIANREAQGSGKGFHSSWRGPAATEYERQKEFAQHGIQWRVEDAKAAGVHPLFALSGGGAAYSPQAVSFGNDNYSGLADAISTMGQGLTGALSSTETPEQKQVRAMAIRESEARIGRDDAQAAYYRSLAMREFQQGLGQPGFPTLLGNAAQGLRPGGSPGGDGVTIPARLQYAPGNVDAISLKPNEVVSSVEGQSWRAPGTKPMWERADFGALGKWFVPRTDDFWETWGELSWYDKAALIAASLVQEGQAGMPAAKSPNPWEVFDLGDDFYSRGEYVSPRRLRPQLSNQKYFYGR